MQTTVTGSLWSWRKAKNMKFLRQVLHKFLAVTWLSSSLHTFVWTAPLISEGSFIFRLSFFFIFNQIISHISSAALQYLHVAQQNFPLGSKSAQKHPKQLFSSEVPNFFLLVDQTWNLMLLHRAKASSCCVALIRFRIVSQIQFDFSRCCSELLSISDPLNWLT